VENYGKNWDEEFSRYLPSEVEVNTYKVHREFWENRMVETKMTKLLKKIPRKVREVRNIGVLSMVLGKVPYIIQNRSHTGDNKDSDRIRLHLGCGKRKRKGWVNIDIDKKVKPDIVTDAKDLNMFEDESVDEIECCHLFEHLTYPDAVTALKEWYRVLKKGGKLSLELPNFKRSIEILYKKEGEEAKKYAMIGIFGQKEEMQKVDAFQLHKYGWTPETLTDKMREIGFSEIKQVPVTQTWREATKHNRDMRLECAKKV